MRRLAGIGEVFDHLNRVLPGHPWPLVCAGPSLEFRGAWFHEDHPGAERATGAVAWRGGHPWDAHGGLHILGTSAASATLFTELAAAGERVIVATEPSSRLWTLRTCAQAPPMLPGEARVQWLSEDSAAQVEALLDLSNPHAAVRSRDPVAGRALGIRDADGRLLATALETTPAAPYWHLSSLAVDPTARREGLGAAVTGWFVRQALASGAPGVLLGVDAGNSAGDRLYDRLGFDSWSMGETVA